MEEIMHIIDKIGSILIDNYQKVLAEENINRTGKLSRTASYSIDINEETYILNIDLQYYWKFVEDGHKIRPSRKNILGGMKVQKVKPRRRKTFVPGKHPLEKAINRTLTQVKDGIDEIAGAIAEDILKQSVGIARSQFK